MRQYTTKEQTRRLMNAGLHEPKGMTYGDECDFYAEISYRYSIGELIDALPIIDNNGFYLTISPDIDSWTVGYTGPESTITEKTELIDALFEEVIKYKTSLNENA